MKKKTMTVETLRHKDVRGKENLYVKLLNENGEYIINVGEATVKAIDKLQEHTEEEKLEVEENKMKKGGRTNG